ncbi:MAG: RluA family pseudouridine synthase [Verrucomicrobia bacterium]|jgi:tRNA pseudouridine65 synthase|nr:RluA family pseudouridine synthase [Verrucomicrobiota bacterium]
MTDHAWIPFGRGVRLLAAHPSGLLAVEKPEGILAHPNHGEAGDRESTLIQGNYSMEEEAFHIRDGVGGIRRVYLLNRLDSPTSGVLLLSLDAGLADAVKELFAKSKVAKKYVAIVKGRGLRQPRGTWQDQLVKSKGPGGGVRSGTSTGGGAPAVTLYQWEKAAAEPLPLSLLKLEPRTGRTHQLRVQTADHGHPILGDRTYGDFEFNKTFGSARGFKRLFLHAFSTELTLEWQGKPLTFSAVSPIPQEFHEAMGGQGDGNAAKVRKPTSPGTVISPRLRIRL